MWALGCSQLMQAQIGAVEEEPAASEQLLLHGRQAAPLLNEPQHLQGWRRRDTSRYDPFQSAPAGAFIFIANWQLGHRGRSKSKKNTLSLFFILKLLNFQNTLELKTNNSSRYSFLIEEQNPSKKKINKSIYIYFQWSIHRKSPDDAANKAPGTKA